MPPWSADPNQSLKFKNDARLSAADIATLRDWVKAGTPKGEDTNPTDLVAAAQDWHGPDGRKPDLVVSMTHALQIPANGDLPYVQILIPVPLLEDKWVSACQARPGNAAVVHHMAITELTVPDGMPVNDLDGLTSFMRQMHLPLSILQPAVKSEAEAIDMLAIYTPGSATEQYDQDSAKLLRGGKNYYLAFNIHYTANGRPATDRSQVAFWFRDSPPKHQILRVAMSGETILANGKELLTDTPGEKAEGTRMAIPPIAPGEANYELTAITAFARPTTIYQLHPHAHFRAKAFKYVAVYPDGREQTLLTIPKYDFHWQLAYELQQPLTLPAGSKLVVTAHYDNSATNEFNPAPGKEVLFRPQNLSTDEMFSPFIQYSENMDNSAALPIVETVGCLVQNQGQNAWQLIHATLPASVTAQATGSAAVRGRCDLRDVPVRLTGKEVALGDEIDEADGFIGAPHGNEHRLAFPPRIQRRREDGTRSIDDLGIPAPGGPRRAESFREVQHKGTVGRHRRPNGDRPHAQTCSAKIKR